MSRRIGLFDLETIRPEEGDSSFTPFFAAALALSTKIKIEAPVCNLRLVAEGVVRIERRGIRAGAGADAGYVALLNLDGRSGAVEPAWLDGAAGKELLGGSVYPIGERFDLPREPVLFRLA